MRQHATTIFYLFLHAFFHCSTTKIHKVSQSAFEVLSPGQAPPPVSGKMLRVQLTYKNFRRILAWQRILKDCKTDETGTIEDLIRFSFSSSHQLPHQLRGSLTRPQIPSIHPFSLVSNGLKWSQMVSYVSSMSQMNTWEHVAVSHQVEVRGLLHDWHGDPVDSC